MLRPARRRFDPPPARGHPVGHVQTPIDVLEVLPDRAFGDVQPPGDLAVRGSGGHQTQDLLLPERQGDGPTGAVAEAPLESGNGVPVGSAAEIGAGRRAATAPGRTGTPSGRWAKVGFVVAEGGSAHVLRPGFDEPSTGPCGKADGIGTHLDRQHLHELPGPIEFVSDDRLGHSQRSVVQAALVHRNRPPPTRPRALRLVCAVRRSP